MESGVGFLFYCNEEKKKKKEVIVSNTFYPFASVFRALLSTKS